MLHWIHDLKKMKSKYNSTCTLFNYTNLTNKQNMDPNLFYYDKEKKCTVVPLKDIQMRIEVSEDAYELICIQSYHNNQLILGYLEIVFLNL